MTRKVMYDRLPKSRVIGLGYLAERPMTAAELGRVMWPGHKMALINAKAIFRELSLGHYIEPVEGSDAWRMTGKAKAVLENPPWLCKYCSLDTSDSRKRLWAFGCAGCGKFHNVCRYCRKYTQKVTGEFPYEVKARGCPGTVEIPRRPERKPKPVKKEPEKKPIEVQADFWEGARST